MGYQIGELDQRISLVSKAEAGDGVGGVTTTETVYATVWAHVRPLRGQERKESDRVEASGDYLIAIRNRSDVNEGHIVRWGSRDLNVRFIRNRGSREIYLELECAVGVAV
jgi:SPP1 family predicted phage head-tail adaptor